MKYFGTDGIRDRVKGPLLEPSFVLRLGEAVGQWLRRHPKSTSYTAAIGRDTRASGGYLFLSLARGLEKAGIQIFDGGVCPTPAIAGAVRLLGLDLGIVVTASHNPATDNGIKLFGSGGYKLKEADEEQIESILDSLIPQEEDLTRAPAVRYFEARRHYISGMEHILPEKALLGLRIVLDCANGATYRSTGELLTQLGAQVIAYGCSPNGDNINAGCGSEHPEVISRAVRDHSADLGISHDGDGDRLILCDQSGAIVDGDAILAILGTGWRRRDRLPGNTVVATVMSNLGLDQCLREAGVDLVRTGVGDRQVFFAMQAGGFRLGGESSGHFIATDYQPTGDGLLAALLVLQEMLETGKPLAELASVFQPFPQRKRNLAVRQKIPLNTLPGLQAALRELEEDLGTRGRILLRYSGTEPKIRLLAEAREASLAEATLAQLQALVESHLEVLPAVP